MVQDGLNVDHATIHYHQGPETKSQAAANYAGAACLVGFAVMSIGVGVGYIVESVRTTRKKKFVVAE